MTTFIRQRELTSLIGAAIAWSRAQVACSADWTLTMAVVMTTDLQGQK
jgi:hypothetical protein